MPSISDSWADVKNKEQATYTRSRTVKTRSKIVVLIDVDTASPYLGPVAAAIELSYPAWVHNLSEHDRLVKDGPNSTKWATGSTEMSVREASRTKCRVGPDGCATMKPDHFQPIPTN
jgi:hypothetical protein